MLTTSKIDCCLIPGENNREDSVRGRLNAVGDPRSTDDEDAIDEADEDIRTGIASLTEDATDTADDDNERVKGAGDCNATLERYSLYNAG